MTSGASGHGGLSPWVVHNTLVLWGSDFESRARITAPASLADLMPTVLTLLAVQRDPCGDGVRPCSRGVPARFARSPSYANTPDGDDEIRHVSGPAPDLERRGARLRRRRGEGEMTIANRSSLSLNPSSQSLLDRRVSGQGLGLGIGLAMSD